MEAIVLEGGVMLPLPVKAKGFKRPDDVGERRWRADKGQIWGRAYLHCLYVLPLLFELPLHTVVPRMAKKMLEASDPFNVALRFMGEMEKQGYIRFDRGYDERIVMPTKKLLDLELDMEKAPQSAIQMPVDSEEVLGRSPIRGGIASEQNKRVAAITSDMAGENFEVNDWAVDLIKEFPPEFDKVSSAYMYHRALASAKKLSGKKFKFPYFLDSRSRMYVSTTCGISPQGADYEKAMILPTYKEPLTLNGVEALKETVEGYSEMGWTIQESLEHVRNPAKYKDEWLQADKPYSYMATAKLLLMYYQDPTQPLPAFCPLDGRCSGLQHWSAVVRSSAITMHLGMDAQEHLMDIYERVAHDWSVTLPEEHQQYATRKAAKIPVMTWAYNATIMTAMEWISKMFGAKRKWCKEAGAYVVVGEGLERATTGRLGADLYQRLNDTLGPLQAAVSWVTDGAGIISSAGNVEVTWPTPDGFQCVQRKVKGERLQLKCTLSDGEAFLLEVLDFTKETPNTAKHRSAIAPNVIHSLDATHLRMVARLLKELGLPMIFIHDSFATHVNHRAKLYEIIVETFIELYSMDYLRDLKTYWESRYGVVLTDPPALGDWEPVSMRGLERFFL